MEPEHLKQLKGGTISEVRKIPHAEHVTGRDPSVPVLLSNLDGSPATHSPIGE